MQAVHGEFGDPFIHSTVHTGCKQEISSIIVHNIMLQLIVIHLRLAADDFMLWLKIQIVCLFSLFLHQQA